MSPQALPTPLHLALFQPDMAGNMGAAMRLCACLGISLDVIEPCGFVWDDRKMDRAAMDYRDLCDLKRHADWDAFLTQKTGRIVLLTTKGAQSLYETAFQPGDILLAGRESAGAPDFVHDAADCRVKIPLHGPARSLNLVTACAIACGEALRQLS